MRQSKEQQQPVGTLSRTKTTLITLVGGGILLLLIGSAFWSKLSPPPNRQRVGDLTVFLYTTLTGAPQVGENQFEVKLTDLENQPVSDAVVTLQYGMRQMGGGTRAPSRAAGLGLYQTTLYFPMAGTWDVEVRIQRAGKQVGSALFTFTLP